MRLSFILSIILLACIDQLFAQCNITVTCRPQPPSVECECDIPPINPLFTDFETSGNADLVAFESLGFAVSSTPACGNLVVTANDTRVHPESCNDTFFVRRVYQIQSISGAGTQTCIDSFKTEFIPANFQSPRLELLAFETDCASNVDSIFADYISNFSFAPFLDCPGADIQYTENPILTSANNVCPIAQSLRSQLFLRGPCANRCPSDSVNIIRAFIVLDTFRSSLICPQNPPAIDVSDPMIDDIITDLLDDFTLEFNCMEPVVSNNYSIDSIQFMSCDPEDLLITINADEVCTANSSSCTITVEIENNIPPEITFIPDTLKLECGDPDNISLVSDWLGMSQAISSQGIVINLNNTSSNISNITHNFDFNLLNDPICDETLDIIFTAFDNCSKSISQNGVITISDTQGPTVLNCPQDTTVNADDPNLVSLVNNWVGSYAAMDNCNPNPIISNNFDNNILGFNCGNVDTLVTFLANDLCNEVDSFACSATLSILDNVMDQFFGTPNDTTIQCENPVNIPIIQAWASSISAANTLGTGFTVDNDLDFFNAQFTDCTGEVIVTFFFENQCGIRRETIARIQITDDIRPTITCPPPATFEGSFDDIEDDITAWLGMANPQDNCSATSDNDYSSFRFTDCDRDTLTESISFFARDNCNNFSSNNCAVDLTIISDKSPLISCPPQLTLQCGTPGIMDSIQQWLTFDGSDFAGTPITASSDFNPALLNSVTCGENTEVTFTVNDTNCNRSVSCMSIIRIEDTLNPEITCPGNITINSTDPDAQLLLNEWIFTTPFEDNGCSTPDFSTDPSFDQTGVDFCEMSASTNVEFRVVDMCNLQDACISILTINDAPPVLTCPANDLSLECGDTDIDFLISEWLAEPVAMTNSQEDISALITNDFNTILADTCFQSIPVVFTIIDNCGLESSCTRNIELRDTRPPTVDCPSTPLNLLAGDTLKIPKFEAWLELIPADDCNEIVLTDDFDENQLSGFSCEEEDFDARLTFTDECGFISNCQVMISIQNNIQTNFINCTPGTDDFTVECGNPDYELQIREWMALVTAEDVFGSSFPTTPDLDFNNPDLFDCTGSIPIIFELVDLCDNSQACGLTLNIIDTSPPEITICPSDTTFLLESPSFNSDVDTWLQSIESRDNCISNLNEDNSYTDITSLPMCQASIDVDVTFTSQDGCGNSSNCRSTLTVTTDRVPMITCPANLTVECGDPNNESIIDAHFSNVQGFDPDGGSLPPAFAFDISELNNFNCDGAIPVLFTIEDNCNIQDTCSIIVSLEDTTPPTTNCPTPLTINSTNVDGPMLMQDWIDSFMASDNCSVPTEEIQSGVIVPATLCNSEEEMNIEFYAEDACGLRDTCIATITINKAAPEITCNNNLNIQCGDDSNDMVIADWISTITASDNNGAVIAVTNDFTQANFNDPCDNSVLVTFTAIDRCGIESEECIQTISQVDTIAPAVTACPQSIVFDVSTPNLMGAVTDWLGRFSAMDQCNSSTTSNDFELTIDAFDCGSAQDVIFTAVDECGNENTDCLSNISFENQREVSILCPDPIQVNCNEPTSLSQIQSFLIDFIPMSEDPIFEVENNIDLDNLPLDCAEVATELVTITIIDNCGNTNDCETSIEFLPAANVYIPTVFDPSLDGENAFFAIRTNVAVQEIESMRIYSRWGDLMFERENFDPNTERGWNGRNSFGKHVQGVYTYVIIFQDIFGNPFEEVGTITLL